MKLLCLGFGYSARHYVGLFGNRFPNIVGTARQPRTDTVPIVPFGGVDLSPLNAQLVDTTHLLVSVPPSGRTADTLRDKEAPRLQHIVYLSSIGVYGDHSGAWVNESAPCHPDHQRGDARLADEQEWQAFGASRGVPVAVLRLAGIYGPGQSALDRLRDGRAQRVVKPGHVFNRIHVTDIAQATDAAFERRFDGIVNVADDEPAPGGDPIAFAAGLLGVPPPPEVAFDDAELSTMAKSFYAGCIRIDNSRLKNELGVTLRYPTYREGLRAIYEVDET